MFTPQEVSEKTFPKTSGFNNGYGMAAVDEFLDALTEDYTALYKDNAALKAKLKEFYARRHIQALRIMDSFEQ